MEGEEWQGVKVVQGDALNPAVLRAALEDADAVVVALGTRKNTDKTTLFSDVTRVLLGMDAERPLRIPMVFITGFGAGDSKRAAPWVVRLLLRFLLKDVYADKSRMESLVEASDWPWTIVRPGQLIDGPFSGDYRVETSFKRGMATRAISRADVADYCVAQCASQVHVRQHVGLFGD